MRSPRLLNAATCALAVAVLGAAVTARDQQGGAQTGGQVRTVETRAAAPPPKPPRPLAETEMKLRTVLTCLD